MGAIGSIEGVSRIIDKDFLWGRYNQIGNNKPFGYSSTYTIKV